MKEMELESNGQRVSCEDRCFRVRRHRVLNAYRSIAVGACLRTCLYASVNYCNMCYKHYFLFNGL
jgi:hypothetical protein